MEVLFNGYVLEVDVTHFHKGRPPIVHLAPEDCYEGDDDEIEYNITAIEIDCGDTVIDNLGKWDEDELRNLVIEKYKEDGCDE